MGEIKLFEGCFVKTEAGALHGPLTLGSDAQKRDVFRCGLLAFWPSGGANDHNLYDTLMDGETTYDIISVYPSLSAAASANPDM